MPNFVLNRTHVLAALGHRIRFEKGQPTWVPPALVTMAASIGAECADGPVDPLGDEEAAAPLALTADERQKELIAAISIICERNSTGDFGGDGRPTLDALHKIVDFATSKKELGVAWTTYKAAQGDN